MGADQRQEPHAFLRCILVLRFPRGRRAKRPAGGRGFGGWLRMIPEPGLYTGTLRHRRFRPRAHDFTYRLFMAWLDIDRIPDLMQQSPFTSDNLFNWASFEERDRFGDPSLSLRKRIA